MKYFIVVFIVFICSINISAVDKSVVYELVNEAIINELNSIFSGANKDTINIEYQNKDVIDVRVFNAAHVSVDLIKNEALVGRRVVRVSLYNDRKEFQNYFSLFLKVSAKTKAVVANKMIKHGTQINEGDVSIQLVDIRNKRANYFITDVKKVIGKISVHSNREGDPFYKWSIVQDTDVSKGTLVKAGYLSGAFEIGVTVEVLQDANIGDKVKVKVKPNDKIVEAVVKEKNYVEIISGT